MKLCFSLFGVWSLGFYVGVNGLVFAWRNWFRKYSLGIWNLMPPCLMWIIWTEHKRRMFEDLENLEDQPFTLFVGTLFEWSHTWGFTSSDSVLMFIDSFLLYIIFLFSLDYFVLFVESSIFSIKLFLLIKIYWLMQPSA